MERKTKMGIGMRGFGRCLALAGWVCGVWVCGLQPPAAAQPEAPTAAHWEENQNGFALPVSGHAFFDPDARPSDSPSIFTAQTSAPNKPRLYNVDRQTIEPQPQQPSGPQGWRWSLNMGYRQDDLKWSTQGTTPDFLTLPQRYSTLLSELTWSDLQILQFDFGLQAKLLRDLFLKGQLGYGTIFDGSNQDSDYWDDNRAVEWSRSLADSDSGETWDLSIAVGYDFQLFWDSMKITPLAGFSYHGQNLIDQNGVQVIADYGFESRVPPGTTLDYLNSTYDTTWYGPWIGGELGYIGVDRFSRGGPEFVLGGEYHRAEYIGEGYWNLRFLSFEQKADADGWVLYAAFRWFFNSRWALNLDTRYQYWETDSGTTKANDIFGGGFETVFNGAEWESIAATIGVTCRW